MLIDFLSFYPVSLNIKWFLYYIQLSFSYVIGIYKRVEKKKSNDETTVVKALADIHTDQSYSWIN